MKCWSCEKEIKGNLDALARCPCCQAGIDEPRPEVQASQPEASQPGPEASEGQPETDLNEAYAPGLPQPDLPKRKKKMGIF